MITILKQFPLSNVLEMIARDFPTHELVRIDDTMIDPSMITHLIESENLFGQDRVIFISHLPREMWDGVIDAVAHLSSKNHLFWLEDSFPASYLKKIPDAVVKEYTEKVIIAKPNPFSIANILPSGDGTKLWAEYQKLIAEGSVPEELFGIIWWKCKEIAKGRKTLSADFKKTLQSLLKTYGSARESNGSLKTGLEKTLLSITQKNIM
jgi:hypothetical protein